MSPTEPSPIKTLFLSVQHVLAMYAAAVVVPLIVGRSIGLNQEQLTYLIAIDIFMCGVATILQAMRNRFFGIGLPIVLGCTFTAVGPMIAIGNTYGVTAIYGAILVAGAALLLSASAFGALIGFFPPVVTGSLVTIIGVTLVPVAIHDIAGGIGASDYGELSNLGLGFGVLTIILIVYRLFRGYARSIAVLIGLLVGTLVAASQGGVSLTHVHEASWFHIPELFYFGAPTFHAVPIVTMLLVVVIGVVEAAGVYLAVSDICGVRLAKDDIARGYRAEGLAIVLGGLFNAFPYTTYSQNVGLVQLSGVRTSRVVLVCGILLVTLGLIPKIAALTMIIPKPVMGGAMLAMFGLVMAYGIKMLSKVDFEKMENLLIVACSVGMGLGVTVVPQAFEKLPEAVKMVTTNGIVVGSMTALALNFFFSARGRPRSKAS